MLGNNNALLTDWKVSPSLPLSRSISSRAGSILPAVAQQQLFESPVALVTAAGENGGLMVMQGVMGKGEGGRKRGGVWLTEKNWVAFS